MGNSEIQHWGIKGMRWGVRRFQNTDGSLTAAGKKRYSDDSEDGKDSTKSKSGKPAETDEERKQRILRSGKASEVLEYQGRLTNQELQEALTRINIERQLSDIQAKEVQTGLDKFTSVMDKVGRVTDGVQKGVNAYNLVAKIANTFTAQDKQLPVLDGVNRAAEKATKIAEEAASQRRTNMLNKLTPDKAASKFDKLSTKELEDLEKRYQAEEKISKRVNTDTTSESGESKSAAATPTKNKSTKVKSADDKSTADQTIPKNEKSGADIVNVYINNTVASMASSESASAGKKIIDDIVLPEKKD